MDGSKEKSISREMARTVMEAYTPDRVVWHYEHGLVLQSLFALASRQEDQEMLSWVKSRMDLLIREDGTIRGYREEEYNLDQINPGKLLFDLLDLYGEDKYRTALETLRGQLKNQPRTETGGFWHKKIYPRQMWLDGLYMQGPFYARYARQFGSPEDTADVLSQLILIYDKTRDPRTGLLYHAWDESRKQLWADPDTGCSPHFWGRALGWYGMALTDVLDQIPEKGTPAGMRERILGITRELAAAILDYQDKASGLWFQVLDQGRRDKNYLETSASAMFVYYLLKMSRTGVWDARLTGRAVEAARKGYRGLVDRRITRDGAGKVHLQGICSVAGLGGNPYRDGSFEYYVKEPVAADDFKGGGPFILAALEAEELPGFQSSGD